MSKWQQVQGHPEIDIFERRASWRGWLYMSSLVSLQEWEGSVLGHLHVTEKE